MKGLGEEQEKLKRVNPLVKLLVGGLIIISLVNSMYKYIPFILQSVDESVCPVFDIIRPESFYKDNLTVETIFHDALFRNASIKKLSGAVSVDTQIFDNQPDVADAPEVWEKFKKFHSYLEKTFPSVYEKLEVETVNTYGLVFYWKGSDPDLKPVMLTAHQDTVPIQKETLGDWSYPPLEGHYDGKYLYGRGSVDCKNVLTAIMESLELLLSKNFEPKRGIIAAFGFDEEASGIRGAYNLGKHLEEKFGQDSIYSVIDEGPGITHGLGGDIIAMPGTGEKGYADLVVDLTTPGGHSSIPPDHTSIGIMGDLAHEIENDQFESILTEKNPFFGFLQCNAVHSRNMSSILRKSILRAGYDSFANSRVVRAIRADPIAKYLIGTSQAIDIVNGGEKANALPENVKMVVNHRIAIESNYATVRDHFLSRVILIAKKYNLGLSAFGERILPESKNGEFEIKDMSNHLEPAPVTPEGDEVWKYIAGTTRHIFEDYVFTNLTYPIVMTPGIMTGNTDTRYYWNLSKNIFRYSPFYVQNFLHDTHVHSVDERLEFDGHLQLIAFFYEYLQAVNTAKADNKNI